jgi:nickel transport protein
LIRSVQVVRAIPTSSAAWPARSAILIAFVLICLVSAAPASAHGAGYKVLDGGMVGVRATFDSGEPVANAPVLIFAPGETRAELTATTDRRGVICFAPDRAGVWVLQIRAEGGHGLRINLAVDESMLAAAPPGGIGSFTTWQKLVMALCVVWGFTATALLFRRRRREG